MLDRIKSLAVFAEVVRAGSFRGAARKIGLSPSVVSRHVTELEDRLGVALLYRSTRLLALTDDGRRLAEQATQMLDIAEAGIADAVSRTGSPAGKLRVTMPILIATSPLLPLLARFAEMYPRLRMDLSFSDAYQDLIAENFDLAIRMGWPKKTANPLLKLCIAPRRLVCSARYANARPTPRAPEDLGTWRWIRFAPRPQRVELYHPDQPMQSVWGIDQLSVDSTVAMQALAIDGAGIATLPAHLVEVPLRDGALVELLPDWRLPSPGVYANWPAHTSSNTSIRSLVDYLRTNTAHLLQADPPFVQANIAQDS